MNQTPALLALAALPLLVGLVLWTYGLMVSKRSGLGVLLALASICLPAFVLAQAAPIYLEDASRLLYSDSTLFFVLTNSI